MDVVDFAYQTVMQKLKDLGGKPTLRMCTGGKAGPIITDAGNLLIDVDFGEITNPEALNVTLLKIAGVVETGLFIGMADKCYFGEADGSVVTTERKR